MYQLGLVTIPCNNQYYKKTMSISLYNFLFLCWQWVRPFLNILRQYIFSFCIFYDLIFWGLAKASIDSCQLLVIEFTVTFSTSQYSANLQTFLSRHLFLQYINTVVVCQHDSLQYQYHHWIFHWGCIPCNVSQILEQHVTFHTLHNYLTTNLSSVSI